MAYHPRLGAGGQYAAVRGNPGNRHYSCLAAVLFATYQLAVLGADVITDRASETIPTRAAAPVPTRSLTIETWGNAFLRQASNKAFDYARSQN